MYICALGRTDITRYFVYIITKRQYYGFGTY